MFQLLYTKIISAFNLEKIILTCFQVKYKENFLLAIDYKSNCCFLDEIQGGYFSE